METQEDTLARVKSFITDTWPWVEKPLDRETELEKDLGIYGDDADEIIFKFSEEFAVDISDFERTRYFRNEGIRLFSWLFKKDTDRIALTIGDLEQAAIKGKLQ